MSQATHQLLLRDALEAVRRVRCDDSVSLEVVLGSLEQVQDELEEQIIAVLRAVRARRE